MLTRSASLHLRWLVRRLRHVAGAYRGRYLHLTPPSFHHARVRDRQTGRTLPFQLRHETDLAVLEQIFMGEDYGLEKLVRAPELRAYYAEQLAHHRAPLIIDCGANIGLSTAYFNEQFPDARIVAVEPDAHNIAQARLNAVSPAITWKHAAIGGASGRAELIDPGLGTTGFRTAASESGGLAMITVDEILADPALATCSPFLIKIDIEGAEADLFSGECAWIDRFPLIIIELHDWMLPGKRTAQPFLKQIAKRDRDFVHIGDNVYSLSNTLLPAPPADRRRQR